MRSYSVVVITPDFDKGNSLKLSGILSSNLSKSLSG